MYKTIGVTTPLQAEYLEDFNHPLSNHAEVLQNQMTVVCFPDEELPPTCKYTISVQFWFINWSSLEH